MFEELKVLVCCHKPCCVPRGVHFLPIQVGAAISSYDLGFQRDDQRDGKECDNISKKNASYCELTALYWAWRNLLDVAPDTRFVGINHYRRYFSFDQRKPRVVDKVNMDADLINQYELDLGRIHELLDSGYVISSRRRCYPYSVFQDYAISHNSEDMRTLIRVIHEQYPDFDDAVYKVLLRNNKLSPYNMGIMCWDYFDEYCSWLFHVLAETESRIVFDKDNVVQRRVFGYMAERLWNVWLAHTRAKVSYFPIYQFTDEDNRNNSAKAIGNYVRKDFAYKLSRNSTSVLLAQYDAILNGV